MITKTETIAHTVEVAAAPEVSALPSTSAPAAPSAQAPEATAESDTDEQPLVAIKHKHSPSGKGTPDKSAKKTPKKRRLRITDEDEEQV